MILQYKKIKESAKSMFTMPKSLLYIKTLSKEGMLLTELSLYDIVMLYYSIKIDVAEQYLRQKNKSNNVEVQQATEEDFNNL